MIRILSGGACALALLATPALAHGDKAMPNQAVAADPACAHLHVHDGYARASTAMSASGAAFMLVHNHGDADDRLIAARSDIAERTELHTHREDAQGVMRMIEVVEGFDLPAGGELVFARGGDHVMFLGLRGPLTQGVEVTYTLVFESGCEIVATVPVDMERQPTHGGHGHSHSHGHKH